LSKTAARPVARKATGQPFQYPLDRDYLEPDWTRLPGYRRVSRAEWEDATWQRKNTVKTLAELKDALGAFLTDDLARDLERDVRERATMSMLITPHMINTMDEENLAEDPLRRYMLPAFSDRRTDWPSHPKASRDSLHEAEMWKVEGLTHRYPTKVLAEMLSTWTWWAIRCPRSRS
jgi:lysine 2,3-aminomutase